MAINFNEELLRVEFVIGEDTVTETVTGNITIPAGKPDIERVIDARASLRDVTTTVEDEGVELVQRLDVGVIYVGDVEEPYFQQPVHFVGTEADPETVPPIEATTFVDIPEAEAGMNVFTDITVRRVSARRIDARTIEVTIILTKFVKVTEYRQITVITEVTGLPEENVTEELLRVEDVIGENTVTSVISCQLSLPAGKPPIQRILNATAEVNNVTTEITDEGVIVDGNIFGGVMYVANVPPDQYQQPVHFLENTCPFSEAIDVAGAEEGMNAHVNLTVKRVSADFIDEETVELNAVIQFFVKVTETRQINVVVDVISDQVEVERELLRVEDVIGEDTVHETVTGRFNIPVVKPEAERIIETNAKVIGYTAKTEAGGVLITGKPKLNELEEGEVPAEGIEFGVVYVGIVPPDEFQQPVHFVEGYIDIENFIDIPGTEEGMNVHTEVEVTRASAQIISNATARTLEVTAVLRKFAKVTEFRQMEIVTDIVVVSPAAGECPPSYIVYVVQPGDTLWKIAKRYHTTVDALINANPNINPQNLQIGQKICVPKEIIEPRG